MRIGLRPAGAVVAALTLALLAACGGDDDGEGSATGADETTTSEPAEDATTTSLSEHEQILSAYREARIATATSADPPDPEHPDLLARYAGDALAQYQGVLQGLQAEGFSYVTSSEVNPTVISADGNTAVVEDCFVDRTQLIDTDTREPLSEQGETIQMVRVDMERIDGAWKIVRQEEVGTCIPG